MSTPFNLTNTQSQEKIKGEPVTIPFDAPDHIPRTNRLSNSQNRRRTLTGMDMINSRPSRERYDSYKRKNDIYDDVIMTTQSKRPRQYNTQNTPYISNTQQPYYRPPPIDDKYNLSREELMENKYVLERRIELLMQRFKDLSDIRHTEAEEIAYRFKKSEEIREQAFAEMERSMQELQVMKSGSNVHSEAVERLRQENQRLKEQVKELSNKKENTASTGDTALFGVLTGMKIVEVQAAADGKLYTCVITGPAATHKFSLFISDEEGKPVEYTPLNENNENLASILPEFLLEEIDFSRENLPVFHWRLASSIHSKT